MPGAPAAVALSSTDAFRQTAGGWGSTVGTGVGSGTGVGTGVGVGAGTCDATSFRYCLKGTKHCAERLPSFQPACVGQMAHQPGYFSLPSHFLPCFAHRARVLRSTVLVPGNDEPGPPSSWSRTLIQFFLGLRHG